MVDIRLITTSCPFQSSGGDWGHVFKIRQFIKFKVLSLDCNRVEEIGKKLELVWNLGDL